MPCPLLGAGTGSSLANGIHRAEAIAETKRERYEVAEVSGVSEGTLQYRWSPAQPRTVFLPCPALLSGFRSIGGYCYHDFVKHRGCAVNVVLIDGVRPSARASS